STSSSTSAAPGTSTARCSTCSWRRRFTRRRPSAPQQKTDAAPRDDGPERDERSQDLSNPAQTLHVLSSPSQKKRARSTTVKQCVRHSVRAHNGHPPRVSHPGERLPLPRFPAPGLLAGEKVVEALEAAKQPDALA